MKPNKLPLYELKIEDENQDEIFAISLVDTPAIELDFQFFGKEPIQFAAVSDEKRLIMGPILVPDKRILRIDGEGKPYEVFFTKETVRRLAEMYLEKKYTDKATIQHEKAIKGVKLVESWIVDNKFADKSMAYGFKVPLGAWMGVFRVDETKEGNKIWNDYVKTGKVKGFSIEGLFSHSLVKASLEELIWEKDINDLSEEEAEIFLGKIRALIKKDLRYKGGKKVEMESYSDYPQSVKDAARIAREQNEKVGGKCMTLVGKTRAADLEQGRPLSRETIARMVSYLSRAKDVYEQNKSDRLSCSYIAYKGWGGETALTWAQNKLEQINKMEAVNPSVTSTYPGEAAEDKKKKQK